MLRIRKIRRYLPNQAEQRDEIVRLEGVQRRGTIMVRGAGLD
jgi:hypothetical protein